eukprot:TRINITY_DN15001_c0_g1_i4.p3 TRINITY_DN15001_c0_g1~~TRINITY_DN15001_c0_g1_i4.p3  ORF type:complete len:127 (-),score=36.47 TRINITY_DN15001_c0_g1_i4:91-471(-)
MEHMANSESCAIAGSYQANVGRCMESAPIPRSAAPSRAGLRDRDARLAQILERSSPNFGVFDPEVRVPHLDMESELQCYKEHLELYAGEIHRLQNCLLYTSDAADEEDSVDLGGRRIIKKKKDKGR